MSKLSRRDFIKIAGAALASTLTLKKTLSVRSASGNTRPNIIVIVLDAFSGLHLSLYGYSRLTTPNIDAFAKRSTVFHNHYSAGNFTTAGTASMLTGMIPWKHHAIKGGGLVRPEFTGINPFKLLGSDYQRFAYSQNTWADYLISQSGQDVDRFLSPFSYGLADNSLFMRTLKNDRTMGSIAQNDFLFSMEGLSSPAGSSVFGYLNKSQTLNLANQQKSTRYPKGIPESMSGIPYYNEEVYKGVFSEIAGLETQGSPYFAYIHLYSPHFPYRPRSTYRTLFHDDYKPPVKDSQSFSPGLPENYLLTQRSLYDRQIAQVDEEFGRLIAKLEKIGVLDHSYIIFTSDHGELFERGFMGHGDLFMYEGALRIPLLIRSPKQTEREDIHGLTSNVDLLPTLLSIAGKPLLPDMDGKVLPAFGGKEDKDRPIFSVYALDNSAFASIRKAVISMRKRNYKMIAYLDYDVEQPFELYDLENDPDELHNLASRDVKRLALMKDELFMHLDDANRVFGG